MIRTQSSWFHYDTRQQQTPKSFKPFSRFSFRQQLSKGFKPFSKFRFRKQLSKGFRPSNQIEFEQCTKQKSKAYLKNDFKAHRSLSEDTKKYLSKILGEIKDRMNRDHRQGIIKAIMETCWPKSKGGKPHTNIVFVSMNSNLSSHFLLIWTLFGVGWKAWKGEI